MSFNQLVCQDCNIECGFEQMSLFPNVADSASIGVSWKCPQCGKRSVDTFFLGSNVPEKGSCLTCGEIYEEVCQSCGQSRKSEEKFFASYPSKEEALKDIYNVFNKGLIRRAFLIANYILREDLSCEEAWKFKMSALNFLKLKDLRLKLLREALDAGAPKSLLLSYGRALYNSNRYQESIEIYDKYLDLSYPNKKAVVLAYKANSLVALENYAEAEKLFLASIETDPKRVESYNDYVNLLEDLGRMEEALAIVDKLLKLSLTDEQINSLLEEKSYLYAELEKAEEALEMAEGALKQNPKSSRAHYLRGRALALLGRLEEANGEMNIVLELEPNNPDALDAIKMIDEALGKTKPVNWVC
jgi:tetratricopeptide (TPR) repeat protein